MEYYEVAARWWADKLREPHEEESNLEEPNHPEGSLMKKFQEEKLEGQLEKVDIFEKLLSKIIKEQVEIAEELVIAVDYKQDGINGDGEVSTMYMPHIIEDALYKAGIDYSSIPWRGIMWISSNNVRASYGSFHPRTTIFPG